MPSPPSGTNGTTSTTPNRGCAPSWSRRSSRATASTVTARGASSPTRVSTDRLWSGSRVDVEQRRPATAAIGVDEVRTPALADVDHALEHLASTGPACREAPKGRPVRSAPCLPRLPEVGNRERPLVVAVTSDSPPDGGTVEVPTWEEVARSHGRFIYTVAYRLTGNHDEAQDLVQEVLLRVRRGLASYRPGSMEAWLSRITTNAFLDEVRRKKRRPLEVVPDLPDRITGVDQEPLDVLDTSRLPEHIQEALEGAARSSSAAPSCCVTWSASTTRRSPSRSMSPSAPSAAASTAAGPSSGRCSHDHASAAPAPTPDRAAERLPRRRAHARPKQAEVDDLLARSPEHRAELARLEEARTWLRAPAVRSSRPRASSSRRSPRPAGRPEPKKHKWGMLNLVATAAVWVLVLGFVNMNRSDDVSPDVADLAQTHTEASAGFGGLLGSLGAGQPEPQARPPRQAEDLGEPYWAPLSLPGELACARSKINDDLVGLVYSNDVGPRDALRGAGPARPQRDARRHAESSVDGSQGVDARHRSSARDRRAARRPRLRGRRSSRRSARRGGRREAPGSRPSPSLAERLGDAGRGLLDSFGLG